MSFDTYLGNIQWAELGDGGSHGLWLYAKSTVSTCSGQHRGSIGWCHFTRTQNVSKPSEVGEPQVLIGEGHWSIEHHTFFASAWRRNYYNRRLHRINIGTLVAATRSLTSAARQCRRLIMHSHHSGRGLGARIDGAEGLDNYKH
jgi:hypothetical protein